MGHQAGGCVRCGLFERSVRAVSLRAGCELLGFGSIPFILRSWQSEDKCCPARPRSLQPDLTSVGQHNLAADT
jgi:hypothetical protein